MSPYFDPLMPEFEHEFHNGPSNRAGSMLVTADPAMQADDVALLDATR